MQQVDVAWFKHEYPDAQQADPQDCSWLQHDLPLHAAFVGHTCRSMTSAFYVVFERLLNQPRRAPRSKLAGYMTPA